MMPLPGSGSCRRIVAKRRKPPLPCAPHRFSNIYLKLRSYAKINSLVFEDRPDLFDGCPSAGCLFSLTTDSSLA
jgi:hypothetical protein